MGKQRGKIGKYCKISLQKKFQLLKLTQWGKVNLREVSFSVTKTSERLNINYSTAKTIFFQFQNKKIREKLTFFENQAHNKEQKVNTGLIRKIAAYKLNNVSSNPAKKIKVICTENRKKSYNPGCEPNQTRSFPNESQIEESDEKIIDSQDKKSKTVNQNAENMDDNTRISKDNTNQNEIAQFVNSHPIQGHIEMASQWQNMSYQNAIMNFGQFTYCVDFTGAPFSFQFPLTVPQ